MHDSSRDPVKRRSQQGLNHALGLGLPWDRGVMLCLLRVQDVVKIGPETLIFKHSFFHEMKICEVMFGRRGERKMCTPIGYSRS